MSFTFELLVVQRATGVDELLVGAPIERWVLPAIQVAHRNDVHVRGEKKRLQAGISALDREEQRILGETVQLNVVRMSFGDTVVVLLNEIPAFLEFLDILSVFFERDGLKLQERLKRAKTLLIEQQRVIFSCRRTWLEDGFVRREDHVRTVKQNEEE